MCMEKNIKLSIIVPVYNVEPYIRRCLDSLINQTYKNLEIILVDDGSTDESGQICDVYASKDSRIHVIHKENGGIVSARKAGIVHATGGYTTNVDPDDWIEENAYAYMVEKLLRYTPDMLVLGYKKEHAGFIEEYRQYLEEGIYYRERFWNEFNRCIEETPFFCQPIDMSLCNKVIKTELWKRYQLGCPDTLKKNVDDAVILPCILNVDSVYVDLHCFYHYCVRDSSILWKNQYGDYERDLILSEHLIQSYHIAKNSNKISKDFLLYKLFYHFMLDVPEKLINDKVCMIYPQITPQSNIIVYGKGVFANRFIARINELQYCNVVHNIDKSDAEKVCTVDKDSYDFIVIAIFNFAIVETSVKLLTQMGAERYKILCIDKKQMTPDFLPIEVKTTWDALL